MVSVQGEIGQPGQAPGAIADAAQPESSPPGAGRRTDGPSFSSRLARLRVSTATLIALAAIVSIPAAFVAVTRGEWLLDIGGEDNWIYIKYFTVWTSAHPELRQVMDQHYKATRVPWILPGFLAYRLFGPLAATYVLHLLVLIGGALAFWAGTRRLFGNGAALLATLLLMAYPGFHGSGITRFWNYHGQINLVYYLLGMLCLVFGARSRHPALWYMGAGAALAACMFTGLTYVLVAPAFGAFAIAVHPWIGLRRLLMMVGAGLVGGVLGLAAARRRERPGRRAVPLLLAPDRVLVRVGRRPGRAPTP